MSEYSQLLEIAKEASARAARKIMEVYAREFSVQEKSDKSPITEADIAADKITREFLLNKTKELGIESQIRSEETEDNKNILDSEYLWIVDPIDGTKDFIQKNGEFCVMIALLHKTEIVVGVVNCPALEKLYFASPNGAFLTQNNQTTKLQVSKKTDLSSAEAVVSRNHFGDNFKPFLEASGISNFRHVGSNGIKACLVAEGQADILFNPTTYLSVWDLCAPQIIVEQAGGRFSGLKGEKINYRQENTNIISGVLTANQALHQEFLNSTSGIHFGS